MMNGVDSTTRETVGADPGDLGRRVAVRRRQLGLSVDELADRAGMHAAYLTYVETHAEAQPSLAASARLAAALGTTVAWLRGGGQDQPAGAGNPPPAVHHLEVLDEPTSMALLAAGGVGRVAFDDERGPLALPVNFRMDGATVAFRTGDGVIAAAIRAGQPVSVEVDHIDETRGEGWSVLLSGPAAEVTDAAELARIAGLKLEPWAGGDRHIVVRLTPARVTGRRIRAS